MLRVVVRWVRLTRKDELHWTVPIREQTPQTRFVAEEQARALVRREAAREADRERAGAEERSRADQMRGVLPVVLPAIAGELTTESDQRRLQLVVEIPNPLVVELENLVPDV